MGGAGEFRRIFERIAKEGENMELRLRSLVKPSEVNNGSKSMQTT